MIRVTQVQGGQQFLGSVTLFPTHICPLLYANDHLIKLKAQSNVQGVRCNGVLPAETLPTSSSGVVVTTDSEKISRKLCGETDMIPLT